MLEAVFISDLHLHPHAPLITARFERFIQWALEHTRTVYVLGDLFHVWAGDDCMDDWSLSIAQQFRVLRDHGVDVYFMPGNRDFLLSNAFATLAGFKQLEDPSVIELSGDSVLLAHGDAYCLLDTAHQRFRRITRNVWFVRLFLLLPKKVRTRLVMKVRQQSQNKYPDYQRALMKMDVVPEAILNALKKLHLSTLIHGHTHRPGLTIHTSEHQDYRRFVLSDWDDTPQILCYDNAKGFEFIHLTEWSI